MALAEAFSIKTLQAFNGRFPTMWELRASNSSIVANVSSDQWGHMAQNTTQNHPKPGLSAHKYRELHGFAPKSGRLLVAFGLLGLPAIAGIMEAAETGLYGLPPFKTTVPTPQEARERPRRLAVGPWRCSARYLAGNTRQLAMGVRRYGAMSAVLRNDVVRRRAVILGSEPRWRWRGPF